MLNNIEVLCHSSIRINKEKIIYIDPFKIDKKYNDVNKAKSVSEIESEVDRLQKKYRDLHVKRLYDGICNAYADTIFLDLVSNLERISDHSMNIAESVIENN